MVDRQKAIQALARRMAAERVDAPAPRPSGARIPLPPAHAADLAAGRTHRLRLSVPTLDMSRFDAALHAVAARHEALRLTPVRDSGRLFLAPARQPVARVQDASELSRADPEHPLRWSARSASPGVVVTLAVSAYLVDRACWPILLRDLAEAYATGGLSARSDLDYGDYCYWLAHRRPVDAAAGRAVAQELGQPGPELYWTFAAGGPEVVHGRPVPRHDRPRTEAVDALAAELAGALRSCGWRGPAVRTRRHRFRPPATPVVGRVDEPIFGLLFPDPDTGRAAGAAAPVPAVLDALDAAWHRAEEPLVQLDVDVVDLPALRFDGKPVEVEPLLSPAADAGWQCLLLRQPDSARLYLAGPSPTVPALLDALTGDHVDGRVHNGSGAGPAVAASGRVHPDPRAPRIVAPPRTLSADVVEAAVDRRAAQLRDAGVRPGTPVVIEATAGPETVANLLAALRCRADVLVVDLADPPAWRDRLVAHLPGAARVTADNVVHPVTAGNVVHPGTAERVGGDGEGALLVGLSSSPGPTVLARVPLPQLLDGAAALGGMWHLREGDALVVDAARSADDLVLKALACGLHGADLAVLSDRDGAEAVDLLGEFAGCVVDEHLLDDWAVPAHRLTGLRRTRRGVDPAPDGITAWWTAEAPDTQWQATGDGLVRRSGTARLVDDSGRGVPVGAVGELVVRVPAGTRYHDDPRRTAERLRPCSGGGREHHTGVLAGRLDESLRVLRLPSDRAVRRHRTCLTDAWWALLDGGVVATRPPGAPAAESAFVVSPNPVGPVDLPEPLASATVCVDRAADQLDAAGAWAVVRAHTRRPRPRRDERWAASKEAVLAKEVVEQILGEPVGPDDDLFSLGATSLQLMRILLQVKERTGVEIPLARFFAAPCVATLAQLIGTPTDAASTALELLDEITGES
ncbi:phosphopantetheine-binding protein [Micromonospora sp. DT31]|uniref:phosphopantetheine-binding protein n=1 Tax=Micromonospora sp. DT31 TaxID=3393434 RepID=UPI003CF0A6B9